MIKEKSFDHWRHFNYFLWLKADVTICYDHNNDDTLHTLLNDIFSPSNIYFKPRIHILPLICTTPSLCNQCAPHTPILPLPFSPRSLSSPISPSPPHFPSLPPLSLLLPLQPYYQLIYSKLVPPPPPPSQPSPTSPPLPPTLPPAPQSSASSSSTTSIFQLLLLPLFLPLPPPRQQSFHLKVVQEKSFYIRAIKSLTPLCVQHTYISFGRRLLVATFFHSSCLFFCISEKL